MKLLSIITTLYKSAPYMEKCINSLLNQDIPSSDYDIILINDGSPDDSLCIANQFAEMHSNIRVISHPNKGLAGARNTGVAAADSKYICFVDPDDYIESNSLKKLLDKMEYEELDMLRFNYHVVDKNYQELSQNDEVAATDYTNKIMDGKTFLSSRMGTACYVWAFMYKTSLITQNNITFIEGSFFDDAAWLPRVLYCANRVNSIDIKQVYYYQSPDSLVRSASIETARRQVQGQIQLIKSLSEQKENIKEFGVVNWYNKMLIHCIISMMGRCYRLDYTTINSVIHFIRITKLHSLSTASVSNKIKIKYKLTTAFPYLYCCMLKVKNS